MISAGLIVRAVLFAIAAMLLNIVAAVLWVVIYSTALDPGHDAAYYQAYAEMSAPVASIVAGIPILFAAGWLMARGRPAPVLAGALVGVAYCVIDLAILLVVAGATPIPWTMVAISFATKIGATAAGGLFARSRPALEPEDEPAI